MSQPSDKANPFDPLSFWRTSQDATLDAWSKAMIDLVNTEAYSEATARLLDSYLSVSAPMRKLLSQTMAQVLTQFNMPTEAEVTGLAERLTNIEMRLDDLDARLDTIVGKLETIAAAKRPTEEAKTPPASAPTTPRTRTRAANGSGGATPSRQAGAGRTSSSRGARTPRTSATTNP